MNNQSFSHLLLRSIAMAAMLSFSGFASAQSSRVVPKPLVGPGKVIVHSKFGGQIFGFDIDQNGTEGLLSEAQVLPNGNVLAAVETFDQKTGKILKVVIKTETKDDFVTMGVVGTSVGLVEREHVKGIYVVKRIFHVLNPLDSNQFTGKWTPPTGSKHIIMPTGVSRTQGFPEVSVFAYDNSGNFIPWVFESDVAKNTFGPIVKITDSTNFGSVPPPMAFDTNTDQAILGGGTGAFYTHPVIGVVDLNTGKFSEFTGIGYGFVNGNAVDSADGTFCTTTEDDASVEFYDLKTESGFTVQLPGSGGNQYYSGADVEFDSTHKLFLVAQPNSSSSGSGSTIYVYDTKGDLQETLNGFSFSNGNVIPAHITEPQLAKRVCGWARLWRDRDSVVHILAAAEGPSAAFVRKQNGPCLRTGPSANPSWLVSPHAETEEPRGESARITR